jgi:hypothetical protein
LRGAGAVGVATVDAASGVRDEGVALRNHVADAVGGFLCQPRIVDLANWP